MGRLVQSDGRHTTVTLPETSMPHFRFFSLTLAARYHFRFLAQDAFQFGDGDSLWQWNDLNRTLSQLSDEENQ